MDHTGVVGSPTSQLEPTLARQSGGLATWPAIARCDLCHLFDPISR